MTATFREPTEQGKRISELSTEISKLIMEQEVLAGRLDADTNPVGLLSIVIASRASPEGGGMIGLFLHSVIQGDVQALLPIVMTNAALMLREEASAIIAGTSDMVCEDQPRP